MNKRQKAAREAFIAAVDEALKGSKDYNTSAEAVVMITNAAFDYGCDVMGLTGFQAGWVGGKVIRHMMVIPGPFAIFKAEDLLYPQYDLRKKFRDWIADQRVWLQEQATEKLATSDRNLVARHVWRHWEKLARSERAEEVQAI